MAALPTGTVTFLLTDIEGSSLLWEREPAAMGAATARHDSLIEAAVSEHGGVVVRPRGEGDSRFAVFARASDAVAAALAVQRALVAEPWPTVAPLRVRLALHTGEAELRDGDYYGTAVNRCARLRTVAHGGQVLLSQATADLAQEALPAGAGLRSLGEQRLRDLARPEQVHQLLHADLPADFLPLRSLDAFPHNLPLQLTSFVGRAHEQAEVGRLLAAHRLVTLTGAGGCGKSRLALQVAADTLDDHPDGVWLVELAPLTDPDLVPQAVAHALGVVDQPGQPIVTTLIGALRSRRLLLVLDNCEHLLDAGAALVEALLRGCLGLRVLATSREALGAAGEVAWRVPSLATPDPRQATPSTLHDYAAVHLFVERARQAQPAFAVTDQNAPAVAEICHRLDGMPLAIELAAARVTALTADQIAARLTDRFRLLTGGRRTALRRQQTLQAAIDWSHDLLTEPERVLLRRLAVFTGGWTLDAAEAVGAGEPIAADDVLDLLTHLVEKSLVMPEDQGAEARYRLLETVRQYASDKLLAAGEAAATRDRHRDYFLALAERAMPLLWTRDQLVWFDRLEAEHDNIRAALEWSHDQPDGGPAEVRLAGAMGQFWVWRGHNVEGLARLTAALASDEPAVPPVARALALNWAGRLATLIGSLAPARPQLEESRALALAAGDWRLAAQATRHLAYAVARVAGDLAERRALLEEALRLARRAGEPRELTWVLSGLVQGLWMEGDEAAARPLLDEGLAISRASGDRASRIVILSTLAHQALDSGDYAGARVLIEEGLAVARELSYRPGVVRHLMILGLVARLQGDQRLARASWREALTTADRIGERGIVARTIYEIAGLSAALNQPRRAARLFGATERRQDGATDGIPLDRGQAARYEQDVAAARAALGEAAFVTAWAEGATLTLEEAVAEALADDGGGTG